MNSKNNRGLALAVCAMAFLPSMVLATDYHWNWQQWAGENPAYFSNVELWAEGVAPKGDASADLYLRSVADPDWGNHDGGFYQPQAFVLPSDYMTFNAIRSSMPSQYIKVNDRGAVVRVSDPSGFSGLWRFRGTNNPGFEFTNDGSFWPTVQFLENGYHINFKTTTEATKAAVGTLTAPGLFVKRGPGELKVVNAAPLGTTCLLGEGTLTLGRAPEAVPTAPAEDFIYHLDAMAEVRLETEQGEDGFTYVTKWQQVETDAQPMVKLDNWATPRLVTVNGRNMVDFGAHANAAHAYFRPGEVDALGQAAVMGTSPQIMPVREVFLVAEVTTDSNQMVAPIGGGGSYAWQLNGDIAGNPEYAAGQGDVASGNWMQDGVYKRRSNYPTKHRVVVYSVQGWFSQTESVTRAFDCLAFSGPGTGSAGGLRIGEVIVYSRELTAAEREATQRYLMDKWHDGSEKQTWDMDTVGLTANGTPVNVEVGAVAKVRHVFGSHGAGSDYPHYTLTKKGAGELVIEDAYPRGTLPIKVEEGSIGFTSTIEREAISTDAPASGAYLHLDASRSDTLVMDGGKVARWNDCDGRTTYMDQKTNMDLPTVADTGINGYKCLDFGAWKSGGACLLLGDSTIVRDDPADKRVYPWEAHITEAFVVWKRNAGSEQAPLFSADGWQFVNFNGQVFSEDNAAPEIQGANLTINGNHMWGHTGLDSITEESGFNVYNISCGSMTMPINGLARWTNSEAGGCQIAEYICYQRPLSDQERRNTVAYLMAKWGKGAHPESQIGAIGPVVYAGENATPKIGTDSPRTVASITLEGTARPLVKTGTGTLRVGSIANASAVDVREGSVVVTGPETTAALSEVFAPIGCYTDKVAALSFAGSVDLAETGALHITLPEGSPENGVYPILSAEGGIQNVGNLLAWTKDVPSDLRKSVSFRVSDDGKTLSYEIKPLGMIIIFR